MTSAPASAQEAVQGTEPVTAAAPVVPQQVRYSGKLATRAGDTVEAVFRIYAAAEGGEPLWTETQKIGIGEDGSYSVLLGSADPKRLPQTVFAGGVARWLGVPPPWRRASTHCMRNWARPMHLPATSRSPAT